MLRFMKPGVAGLLFLAAPALAESPFDGTWKARVDSMQLQSKPDSFSLRNGIYDCRTCIPAFSVPADGKYHKVAGKDYWNEVAVTVVDDHSIGMSFRKAGKVISTNAATVSADGMAMTTTAHNTNNGGNVPVDSKGSATRVGQPMPGAHLYSGQWQFAPASSVSDAAMTVSLKVDGNHLHQATGLGETLDATIGGAYALNQGDPGKTMTKVERIGPRSLKMTDMRGGKVTSVTTYTVSDDGTTLIGKFSDTQDGSTGGFTAVKM
jgi:hypothetical protein